MDATITGTIDVTSLMKSTDIGHGRAHSGNLWNTGLDVHPQLQNLQTELHVLVSVRSLQVRENAEAREVRPVACIRPTHWLNAGCEGKGPELSMLTVECLS